MLIEVDGLTQNRMQRAMRLRRGFTKLLSVRKTEPADMQPRSVSAFVADDKDDNNRSKGYFFQDRVYNVRLINQAGFLPVDRGRK